MSIIVPVYNAEKYLDRCVHSILDQKFKDLELILINDGSTDNSGEICDRFASEKYPIKVHHMSNWGASIARNKGIEMASGEFIWFIDADDWVDNDFLSTIDWKNLPDILFFGFKRIYKSKIEKCAITLKKNGDVSSVLNQLYTSNDLFFGYTWNKFFKKKIIDDFSVRFRENLIIKEDEIFTLEFCKYVHSLSVSTATPYNYRILSTSISHSRRRRRNMFELAHFLENILDEPSYPEDLKISLKNSVIRYYFAAMIEKIDDIGFDEAVHSYISYIKTHQESISVSLKDRIILTLPTLYLKKIFLKLYFAIKA